MLILFIWLLQESVATSIPAVGDLIPKQELEGSKLPTVEEHSRPTTKIRTSPVVKPPWMEELKRNQEKKVSIASSGILDKPSVPSAKPTIPKPVHSLLTSPPNFQVNISSGENTIISNEAVSRKNASSKQNNFKLDSSNSSTVPLKYSPSQHSKRSDGSPIVTPVSPHEKASCKDSTLPSESHLVEMKKQITEMRTPHLSIKDHPTAGSNGHDAVVVLKPKVELEPVSKVINKSSLTVSSHPSVSYNESPQSRSDDAVFLELQTLNSRVASLEATILSLQTELLHLKNTTAVHELKCQCMPKNTSNESSLVHI